VVQLEKKTLQDHFRVKEEENSNLEAQVELLAANANHDDTIAALRKQLEEAVASKSQVTRGAADRENSLCGELLAMKEKVALAEAVASQGRAVAQSDAEASVSAAVRIIAYEQALERAQRAEADAKAKVEAAEALTAQAEGEVRLAPYHFLTPFVLCIMSQHHESLQCLLVHKAPHAPQHTMLCTCGSF